MSKQAISVTLDTENLLWLRGQVRARARRSVSEVLDRLVTEARTGGRIEGTAIRSVVGTIRLPDEDPDLSQASALLRRLFPGAEASRRRRQVRSGRRSRGG